MRKAMRPISIIWLAWCIGFELFLRVTGAADWKVIVVALCVVISALCAAWWWTA